MNIAERNAIEHPEELLNTTEDDEAIRDWAASTIRTTKAERTDYQLPCERGVWDIRDGPDSLLPPDSSYTPLLEPR